MKVLHVFKTYLPDGFTGVERVIWEISEGIAPFGIRSKVFFLSDRCRNGEAVGQHQIHTARQDVDWRSTPLSLRAFGQFRRLAEEADLIHYHFPWPMMDVLHLAAGGRKRPNIVTYHSDIVKQAMLLKLYAPLMERFLGSADRIVATSPNYFASSAVLQRHREKVEVIPLGIDPAGLGLHRTGSEEAAWANRLPERFFLFVGALRYYKGLPFLLEAARQTQLPVVVAGSGTLGDEDMRRLPSNVTLLGRVTDAQKAALLDRAYGFVFPSHLRSEAFGVALVEAAFAGRPLISCEIGTGTSYVNRDGETGLVVPPADPEALARAMLKLWKEPGLAAGLGQGARLRAEEHFTALTMARRYADLYRRVLTERSGSSQPLVA
jgi:glycosyltransferase involved in cell wall biosynthesis